MATKSLQIRILELCNSYGTVHIKDGMVFVDNIHGQPKTRLTFTKPIAEEHVIADNKYSPIILRFDLASQKLKYAKMFIANAVSNQYKLQRAGEAATFPGSVNIIDKYKNWIGRIMRDGHIQFKRDIPMDLKIEITDLLDSFLDDAANATKIYGTKFNQCCFCGRALTETCSIELGYGPVCALNFGLPHGQNGDFNGKELYNDSPELFQQRLGEI